MWSDRQPSWCTPPAIGASVLKDEDLRCRVLICGRALLFTFEVVMAAPVGPQALAYGTYHDLCRPCVDCRLYTCCFCDGLPGRGMCRASARVSVRKLGRRSIGSPLRLVRSANGDLPFLPWRGLCHTVCSPQLRCCCSAMAPGPRLKGSHIWQGGPFPSYGCFASCRICSSSGRSCPD